jgi:hypothetical protein
MGNFIDLIVMGSGRVSVSLPKDNCDTLCEVYVFGGCSWMHIRL